MRPYEARLLITEQKIRKKQSIHTYNKETQDTKKQLKFVSQLQQRQRKSSKLAILRQITLQNNFAQTSYRQQKCQVSNRL